MKISEIFSSISGEGMTQGYPTIFVRSVGCNLNCSWCDTNYARVGGEEMGPDEVVNRIESCGSTRHVFFTGGEPLLHSLDIRMAINELWPLGYYFTIKTNGSLSVSDLMGKDYVSFAVDVKTPSSGMADKNCSDNYPILREQDELLYACKDKTDWEFARDHHRSILSRYHCKAQPCFSPVWDNVEEAGKRFPQVGQPWWQELASLMVMEGPWNAKYSIQLHKVIYGPFKRGV